MGATVAESTNASVRTLYPNGALSCHSLRTVAKGPWIKSRRGGFLEIRFPVPGLCWQHAVSVSLIWRQNCQTAVITIL